MSRPEDTIEITSRPVDRLSVTPFPAEMPEPQNSEAAEPQPESTPPAEEAGEGQSGAGLDPAAPAVPPNKQGRDPRNWGEMRKELRERELALARAEAQRELLERQLAESRKSAPTTQKPQEERKAPERPKRPRLSDFEDIAAYETAMDSYEEAMEAHRRGEYEQRFQQQEHSKIYRNWDDQQRAVAKKYTDYEQVTSVTPYSWATLLLFPDREDGAELAYYLGKHPEDAKRISDLTEIPGNYRDVSEFLQAVQGNPRLALQYGEKRALARIELDAIARTLKGETKPAPKPLPKPSSEVAVQPRGAPVGDEFTNIIETEDLQAYKRFQNRRDLERMGIR